MRKSNMELLRIVAMLMVLLLHATFETMHYPSPKLVQAAPDSWLGIILTNQACLCCVDVFVLITGWFGTHFKMQNVWKLLYQVAFISLTITVGISLWSGGLPGSPLQIAQSVLGYWFINSYLVMYLLSPLLNSFTEQQGEAEQRHFLLVFFGLSIPASFLFEDLDRGFSAVSFCGLYLLGRYLRLYGAARLQHLHRRRFLETFAINTFTLSLIYWLYFWLKPIYSPCSTSIINITSVMTAYTNPFVILNAVCLILYFSRLNFSSRLINWLGAGSLAAYLTHQQIFVRPKYFEWIRHLDEQFGPLLFVLTVAGSILLIFVASVVLDQCRQQTWKWLVRNKKT